MTIRGSNEDINKGWVLSHVWLFVTPWIVACQYSCLENPMDGGAWWAAVHGIAKSQTWLSDFFHFSLSCIGEGNGNPLQCSCLENPRDGGAWWAAIYGVPQSRTPLKRLSSSSSRLLCPWDSPGKNTRVGCHFLLQGIFPTQGLNLGLLHCKWILYHLSHQGSPK